MSLPIISTIGTPVTSYPSSAIEVCTPCLDYSNNCDIESGDDNNNDIDCSPTTQQFIKESMAKGLPITPFNYSTEEIVEKRREKRQNKHCFQTTGLSDNSGTNPSSPRGRFDTLDDMNVGDSHAS